MPASKELTRVDEAVRAISADNFKAQLAAALPEGVSVDRFARIAQTTLRTHPELAEAEATSLFTAIVQCAQDGLYPDGREAALVLFGKKAVYMPMIGGYRKIAADYGWSIRASVVYANDHFKWVEGDTPKLEHMPARLGEERGDMIGVYAVGMHNDGRPPVFVVLSAAQVEKIRKTSRTKDSGPWVEWPDRMWEKTAGRQLFKQLGFSKDNIRVNRVFNVDELGPSEATEILYSLPEKSGAEETSSAAGDVHAESAGDPAPDPPMFEGEEPPPPEDAGAWGDVVIDGARHEGKTIAEVWAIDESYVRWLAAHWGTRDVKAAAAAFAEEQGK